MAGDRNDVTFTDGTELGVTYQHPIYSITVGDWRLAGELAPGEEVLTYDGKVEVAMVIPRNGAETVYNLEVKEWHNFLVGGNQVVAHNSCIATGNRICPPARSKPRFSSSTVDIWANNSNFRTKTINPSNDNDIYQIRASGTNVEIEVKGGGKRIFADGVDYDENALVDAKNNASSNTLFDIGKYL